MTSPVLKAIAARAGVSSPSWECVELILRLMAGGHVRWAYRESVARPVSGAVARLRRMRPRYYYFDEACMQGRCAHPQSCPVRVDRG